MAPMTDATGPGTPPERVVAIVLNWNGCPPLLRCLAALARLHGDPPAIIVVDNGSTDDSVPAVRAAHPGVRIVETGANLGFAAGNNVGIRAALALAPEYLWFLNNDTEVLPDALEGLLAVARTDPRLGAVGSTLIEDATPTGTSECAGGSVSLWSGLARHHATCPPADALHYLRGASLLVRGEALEAIGPFDPGYFMYWEDTDLCFRLRAAGWGLAVAAGSRVRHGTGSLGFGSPAWDYHFTASSRRFFLRHAPVPPVPTFVSTTGRLLRRAMAGRWANVRAVWLAAHDERTPRFRPEGPPAHADPER